MPYTLISVLVIFPSKFFTISVFQSIRLIIIVAVVNAMIHPKNRPLQKNQTEIHFSCGVTIVFRRRLQFTKILLGSC